MAMNEEKKAAPPPPRQRRPTKLGLDADDRRNDASNMVHRTDGRRHDFAPGERIPKVGRKPNLMAREKRDRSIGVASQSERDALHRAMGRSGDISDLIIGDPSVMPLLPYQRQAIRDAADRAKFPVIF